MLSEGWVSEELRLVACIELKNSLDGAFAAAAASSWAQRANAGEEREALKAALLERLGERSEALSSQRALCIATVAKYEGTKQWPLLLPSLLAMAALPSPAERWLSLRSSYALHCVLKALQAKRTPTAKAAFASLSQTALPVVSALASHHLRRLCDLLQHSGGRLSEEALSDLTAHSRMANLHLKATTRSLVLTALTPSPSHSPHSLSHLHTGGLPLLGRHSMWKWCGRPVIHSPLSSALLCLCAVSCRVVLVGCCPMAVGMSVALRKVVR